MTRGSPPTRSCACGGSPRRADSEPRDRIWPGRQASAARDADPSAPPLRCACICGRQAAWLQVVPRPGRGSPRAGRRRRSSGRTAPGKSNVSDAIRLGRRLAQPERAAGREARRRALRRRRTRAARPTSARSSCSSTTSDGALPELDYAELSVARRLHRGGEGQYLVNRAAVRRLDLVELLADLGLGGGMHSIISQGKVEAILASKPAERRGLIEEAAGPRSLQAPPASRRAEARAGRGRGRARPRPRGGGQEAASAARAPGDRGRAGREARGRDRARCGRGIAQLDLAGLEERLAELATRRSGGCGRSPGRRRSARGAAGRARTGRGGAGRRGRGARAGTAGALPAP